MLPPARPSASAIANIAARHRASKQPALPEETPPAKRARGKDTQEFAVPPKQLAAQEPFPPHLRTTSKAPPSVPRCQSHNWIATAAEHSDRDPQVVEESSVVVIEGAEDVLESTELSRSDPTTPRKSLMKERRISRPSAASQKASRPLPRPKPLQLSLKDREQRRPSLSHASQAHVHPALKLDAVQEPANLSTIRHKIPEVTYGYYLKYLPVWDDNIAPCNLYDEEELAQEVEQALSQMRRDEEAESPRNQTFAKPDIPYILHFDENDNASASIELEQAKNIEDDLLERVRSKAETIREQVEGFRTCNHSSAYHALVLNTFHDEFKECSSMSCSQLTRAEYERKYPWMMHNSSLWVAMCRKYFNSTRDPLSKPDKLLDTMQIVHDLWHTHKEISPNRDHCDEGLSQAPTRVDDLLRATEQAMDYEVEIGVAREELAEDSTAEAESRYVSPTAKAPPPQPKKMPRRPGQTVQQKSSQQEDVPTQISSPPARPSSQPPRGYAAAVLREHIGARPKFQREPLVVDPASHVKRRVPGLSANETHAMEVLACHTARLGPVAALELEATLQKAMRTKDSIYWNFLNRPVGQIGLSSLRSNLQKVYAQRGKNAHSHAEVRSMLQMAPAGALRAHAEPTQSIPLCFSALKGQCVELPISEVRFAHNDQSEHFAHSEPGVRKGNILQLAVELVTGLTPLSSVPPFTVCQHDGHWYCRSGNRRLAAFRMAAHFAPDRFDKVSVQIVNKDDIFLGRKLTTHLNGRSCEGRWLVIRETGEVVGKEGAESTYGADLLALLAK